jgi:zinc protease
MTRRFIVLAFAAALGMASVSQGEAQTATAAEKTKQQPPAPAAERPFKFPAHATTKLENGLTVFVVEDHRQPVVSVTLMIPGAGSSSHPGTKAGLAAMTAELLRQGTASRTAQQVAETIDRVGGSLNAFASEDVTQASVTVERWRKQTLSGLQVAYSDPAYLQGVVSQRVAYGDHPYAFPVDGFPNTVRSLSKEEVSAFFRERYTPSGSFVAVAGDITADAAAAIVRKHFGAWKGGAPSLQEPPAPQHGRRVVVVDKPDAVQTQFGIVGAGVPRSHADWLALSVANQVLGAGFNSRLNLRLRAKEGLTYGARSSLDSERFAGLWNAGSFTRTDETAKAVQVMLEVIKDFKANPVTAAELTEATSYLSGVFAIQTETAEGVAGRVLTSALYGLPADYWQTYRERVRKIAAAEVTAAVQRHLNPDNLSIVLVGNASTFVKALEPLGSVTIVPVAKLDLTQPELTAK